VQLFDGSIPLFLEYGGVGAICPVREEITAIETRTSGDESGFGLGVIFHKFFAPLI
jgi:hypothetical protein